MADNNKNAHPVGPRKRSIPLRIWKFISTVKLTLFIFFTAALASIIGTVIEQNKPVQTYVAAYGQEYADLIVRFGLDNMYQTWWFIAILLLLVLNIIACTYERFPPKWKQLLKKDADFDPSVIDRLSNKESLAVSLGVSEAREKLLGLFKKRRYKVKVDTTLGDGHKLYVAKGKIGRLGSDVVHISLLLILLGSVIGSYWGYKDFRAIIQGDTVTVPEADFTLRLDKFWIEYYDSGQIKQYNSILTVVEEGKDIFEKHIWVNEPLYYKGIRFYQSSYGTSWNKIENADVALLKHGNSTNTSSTRLEWGKLTDIQDTGHSVRLIAYVSDFAFDESSGLVFSKSGEVKNPAILIEVFKEGQIVARPWLFFNYPPGIVPSMPDTPYELQLMGFRNLPYSGLSIAKDPGVNVVWAGSIVMGIGFILAFFVFYKRIWVHVKETPEGVVINIGGMTNKNALTFKREFKAIVAAISKGSSSAASEGN